MLRAGEPLTHPDRVLGGAVGDAFGYAIEFAGLSEICRRYGADGLREPVLSKSARDALDPLLALTARLVQEPTRP